MVHVARPALPPAVGLCAAKRTQPRRRAALHQAHRWREGAAFIRQHPLFRQEGPAQGRGTYHPSGMKFSVFQVSRKGGRLKNEDRMGYCYTRESGLFVLADGMGGHPEGEVAAQLALQTISALYQQKARPLVDDPGEFLSSAVMAAHHQIIRYASEKGMLDTPRTTV